MLEEYKHQNNIDSSSIDNKINSLKVNQTVMNVQFIEALQLHIKDIEGMINTSNHLLGSILPLQKIQISLQKYEKKDKNAATFLDDAYEYIYNASFEKQTLVNHINGINQSMINLEVPNDVLNIFYTSLNILNDSFQSQEQLKSKQFILLNDKKR